MFDKLKLKLIAINMAMLITVFIAIFGSIFLITSNNIKRDINAKTTKEIIKLENEYKSNINNLNNTTPEEETPQE